MTLTETTEQLRARLNEHEKAMRERGDSIPAPPSLSSSDLTAEEAALITLSLQAKAHLLREFGIEPLKLAAFCAAARRGVRL